MRPAYHRVTPEHFDALASGGADARGAIRELAAGQHSKHVLLLRGVLTTARRAASRQQAQFAEEAYDLLAAAQRHDPAAATAVVRYPSVGAWALRTLNALRGGSAFPGAEPGGLRSVAAAAAIRARLPAAIEVATTGGIATLPSLGLATMPDDRGAVVRIRDGRAEISSADVRVEVPPDPDADAPGWLPLRRIRAGPAYVVLDDLDPFRMPTLNDLAPRLSLGEVHGWNTMLRAAWPLLDPAMAEEVAQSVSVIVPRTAPERDFLSSTAPENFGAVAMSAPPDPSACAATLVHEVQHLKLFALQDVVTLTLPDDGRRHYAPWREDPRPVAGLLQGAYAFLGVSRFWRSRCQAAGGSDDDRLRAGAEYVRWRSGVAQAIATLLSSDRLTPPGRDFVEGMARVLRDWEADRIPSAARAAADREAAAHLTRWHRDNG